MSKCWSSLVIDEVHLDWSWGDINLVRFGLFAYESKTLIIHALYTWMYRAGFREMIKTYEAKWKYLPIQVDQNGFVYRAQKYGPIQRGYGPYTVKIRPRIRAILLCPRQAPYFQNIRPYRSPWAGEKITKDGCDRAIDHNFDIQTIRVIHSSILSFELTHKTSL